MKDVEAACLPVAIFALHAIRAGTDELFREEITKCEQRMSSERAGAGARTQSFFELGPFDVLTKFDTDDISLVREISQVSGRTSQQILIGYRPSLLSWLQDEAAGDVFTGGEAVEPDKLPLACLMQLKIQSHLLFAGGSRMEHAVHELIRDELRRAKEEIKPGQAVTYEIYATLGWEEFIIWARGNSFEAINLPLHRLRSCTVDVLNKQLQKLYGRCVAISKEDSAAEKLEDSECLKRRHVFATTYTIPGIEWEKFLQLRTLTKDLLPGYCSGADGVEDIPDLLRDIRSKADLAIAPDDRVKVFSRISVKPGHEEYIWPKLKKIWALRDPEARCRSREYLNMGRYDIWPWDGEEVLTTDFVIEFILLYSILTTGADTHSLGDIYSTLTDLSVPLDAKKYSRHREAEGSLLPKYLDRLSPAATGMLGEDWPIAKDELPPVLRDYMVSAFSFYDSAIRDRFTFEIFLDMYPFMNLWYKVLQSIHQTEQTSGVKRYHYRLVHGGPAFRLRSKGDRRREEFLCMVMARTVELFYQGVRQRYFSSFPMSDKTELPLDFPGRVHRCLGALAGMQNRLLEAMNKPESAGFPVISFFPFMRIERGPFSISQVSPLHLYCPELLSLVFHEIIHCLAESGFGGIQNSVRSAAARAPHVLTFMTTNRLLLFMEEMAGDYFVYRMAHKGNLDQCIYFYWLIMGWFRKQINSHILLRLLILSALFEETGEGWPRWREVTRNLEHDVADQLKPEDIDSRLRELLDRAKLPDNIRDWLNVRLDEFLAEHLEHLTMIVQFLLCITEFIATESRILLDKYEAKIIEILSADPVFQADDGYEKRTSCSVDALRMLTKFIYDNRVDLNVCSEGILNFSSTDKDGQSKRRDLLKLRVEFINMLFDESLCWRVNILRNKDIPFPVRFAARPVEVME